MSARYCALSRYQAQCWHYSPQTLTTHTQVSLREAMTEVQAILPAPKILTYAKLLDPFQKTVYNE